MKLKLVEVNGTQYAEIQDGKPVYVEDDGKEIAFDAVGTRATISRLNGEAKSHRERAEKAEGTLKNFEGIEDPTAAKKALETVKNLDAKKLVDAGEIETVKTEISKAFQTKLDEATSKAQKLEEQLYAEKIGGAFSRSPFIVGDKAKVVIPADLMQARFGSAFKIEDGNTVAYDHSGNKIYSRARPGEPADFDEALEILVDHYPHKDHILKSTTPPGGGAKQTGAGGGEGKKTISRTQFDALDPAGKAAHVKAGGEVTD